MVRTWLAAGTLALASFAAAPAQAQESYLGSVLLVGFNFCPQWTLPADGREMAISQNAALFSLLGTTFGGNGTTTFALPKLGAPAPGLRYCVVVQGIYPSRP